jgi:glycosyltransferase involved in cell wall biosynthesis
MEAAGAHISFVGMHNQPASLVNARAMARVRALIRSTAPDVVHCHSSIGGAVGRVAATATGVPTVYTPNGLFPNSLATAIEVGLRPLTDLFVAVSEGEATMAVRRRITSRSRLAVIPNGIEIDTIDADETNLRELIGVAAGAPVVGFVGRLTEQKRPLDAVRAWPTVLAARPDATLVVVGDGPLRQAVEDAIDPRTRASVHLLGARPGAGLIAQFDALLLPSQYEGLPYTALEAMRAGTPLVASQAVGNVDVVEHGHSGLLVPIGDTTALAAAVLEILASPPLAARLAAGGKERLAARFDARATCRRLADAYETVSRARHRRTTRQ